MPVRPEGVHHRPPRRRRAMETEKGCLARQLAIARMCGGRPLESFTVSRSDDDQSFAQLWYTEISRVQDVGVSRVADACELREDNVERATAFRFAYRRGAPTAPRACEHPRAPPLEVIGAGTERDNILVAAFGTLRSDYHGAREH